MRCVLPFVGRGGATGPTTWTFASSGTYGPAGFPTQAKLSDGDSATYWASDGTGTVGSDIFLRADFGSAKTLSAISFRSAAAAQGWNETYLNGAVLQHSLDGSTWTTVHTISTASQTVTNTFTLAAPVSARYVRARSVYGVTSGNVGSYLALSEFHFS